MTVKFNETRLSEVNRHNNDNENDGSMSMVEQAPQNWDMNARHTADTTIKRNLT